VPEPDDPPVSADGRKAANALMFDEAPPSVAHAPPIAPEQQEPAEPAISAAGIPQATRHLSDFFSRL